MCPNTSTIVQMNSNVKWQLLLNLTIVTVDHLTVNRQSVDLTKELANLDNLADAVCNSYDQGAVHRNFAYLGQPASLVNVIITEQLISQCKNLITACKGVSIIGYPLKTTIKIEINFGDASVTLNGYVSIKEISE